MKLVFTFGLLLYSCQALLAQSTCKICEDLKRNIVHIKTSSSDSFEGFGTVVSERSNKLYILTAKHVIYDLDGQNHAREESNINPVINVRFYNDPGNVYKARTLKLDDNSFDFTIIEVMKPQDFTWNKDFYSTKVNRGTQVWFIGRAGKWYIPTGSSVGSVNIINSNDEIIVDINSIQPGTSGAPLISENGIVGMIYEDSSTGSRAYPIEKIIKVIEDDWHYDWQMRLKVLSPERNFKPDSTSAVPVVRLGDLSIAITKVERVWDTGSGKKLKFNLTIENNSSSAVSMGLFNNFTAVDPNGNSYEADPFSSRWPNTIPAGSKVSGSIDLKDFVSKNTSKMSLYFSHIFGVPSGNQGIHISEVYIP